MCWPRVGMSWMLVWRQQSDMGSQEVRESQWAPVLEGLWQLWCVWKEAVLAPAAGWGLGCRKGG